MPYKIQHYHPPEAMSQQQSQSEAKEHDRTESESPKKGESESRPGDPTVPRSFAKEERTRTPEGEIKEEGKLSEHGDEGEPTTSDNDDASTHSASDNASQAPSIVRSTSPTQGHYTHEQEHDDGESLRQTEHEEREPEQHEQTSQASQDPALKPSVAAESEQSASAASGLPVEEFFVRKSRRNGEEGPTTSVTHPEPASPIESASDAGEHAPGKAQQTTASGNAKSPDPETSRALPGESTSPKREGELPDVVPKSSTEQEPTEDEGQRFMMSQAQQSEEARSRPDDMEAIEETSKQLHIAKEEQFDEAAQKSTTSEKMPEAAERVESSPEPHAVEETQSIGEDEAEKESLAKPPLGHVTAANIARQTRHFDDSSARAAKNLLMAVPESEVIHRGFAQPSSAKNVLDEIPTVVNERGEEVDLTLVDDLDHKLFRETGEALAPSQLAQWQAALFKIKAFDKVQNKVARGEVDASKPALFDCHGDQLSLDDLEGDLEVYDLGSNLIILTEDKIEQLKHEFTVDTPEHRVQQRLQRGNSDISGASGTEDLPKGDYDAMTPTSAPLVRSSCSDHEAQQAVYVKEGDEQQQEHAKEGDRPDEVMAESTDQPKKRMHGDEQAVQPETTDDQDDAKERKLQEALSPDKPDSQEEDEPAQQVETERLCNEQVKMIETIKPEHAEAEHALDEKPLSEQEKATEQARCNTAQTQKISLQIARILEKAVGQIEPVLETLDQHLDAAASKDAAERDVAQIKETCKPLEIQVRKLFDSYLAVLESVDAKSTWRKRALEAWDEGKSQVCMPEHAKLAELSKRFFDELAPHFAMTQQRLEDLLGATTERVKPMQSESEQPCFEQAAQSAADRARQEQAAQLQAVKDEVIKAQDKLDRESIDQEGEACEREWREASGPTKKLSQLSHIYSGTFLEQGSDLAALERCLTSMQEQVKKGPVSLAQLSETVQPLTSRLRERIKHCQSEVESFDPKGTLRKEALDAWAGGKNKACLRQHRHLLLVSKVFEQIGLTVDDLQKKAEALISSASETESMSKADDKAADSAVSEEAAVARAQQTEAQSKLDEGDLNGQQPMPKPDDKAADRALSEEADVAKAQQTEAQRKLDEGDLTDQEMEHEQRKLEEAKSRELSLHLIQVIEKAVDKITPDLETLQHHLDTAEHKLADGKHIDQEQLVETCGLPLRRASDQLNNARASIDAVDQDGMWQEQMFEAFDRNKESCLPEQRRFIDGSKKLFEEICPRLDQYRQRFEALVKQDTAQGGPQESDKERAYREQLEQIQTAEAGKKAAQQKLDEEKLSDDQKQAEQAAAEAAETKEVSLKLSRALEATSADIERNLALLTDHLDSATRKQEKGKPLDLEELHAACRPLLNACLSKMKECEATMAALDSDATWRDQAVKAVANEGQACMPEQRRLASLMKKVYEEHAKSIGEAKTKLGEFEEPEQIEEPKESENELALRKQLEDIEADKSAEAEAARLRQEEEAADAQKRQEEADQQAAETKEMTLRLCHILEGALEKTDNNLMILGEHLDNAERKQQRGKEVDAEQLAEACQPLINACLGQIQECEASLKGVDPENVWRRKAFDARNGTSGETCTAEQAGLVEMLEKLEEGKKFVDEVKKRLRDFEEPEEPKETNKERELREQLEKQEAEKQQHEEEERQRAMEESAAKDKQAEAEAEEAEQTKQMTLSLCRIIDQAIDKIEPNLAMLSDHLDEAERKQQRKEKVDEEQLTKTCKPLLEKAISILQECEASIKGLDPDGSWRAKAQGAAAGSGDKKATPEQHRLAELVTKLTGEVAKSIEHAKKRLLNFPKTKKALSPLLVLLEQPLVQIITGVGLLLNGVLVLVGNLLNGLGLGGIVRGLLGGLGIGKLLENFGLDGLFKGLA